MLRKDGGRMSHKTDNYILTCKNILWTQFNANLKPNIMIGRREQMMLGHLDNIGSQPILIFSLARVSIREDKVLKLSPRLAGESTS